MSVRMSGGVPLEKVSSSVTWKVLFSGQVGVEETNIPFPLFQLHEDGFQPFEPFPGIKVAFDGGPHAGEPIPDLFGPDVVHDARVEPLELVDQHGIEERAGQATPQILGLLRWQIFPARFFGVADEWSLDCTLFAA